jgi:hypothetical protein
MQSPLDTETQTPTEILFLEKNKVQFSNSSIITTFWKAIVKPCFLSKVTILFDYT